MLNRYEMITRFKYEMSNVNLTYDFKNTEFLVFHLYD